MRACASSGREPHLVIGEGHALARDARPSRAGQTVEDGLEDAVRHPREHAAPQLFARHPAFEAPRPVEVAQARLRGLAQPGQRAR